MVNLVWLESGRFRGPGHKAMRCRSNDKLDVGCLIVGIEAEAVAGWYMRLSNSWAVVGHRKVGSEEQKLAPWFLGYRLCVHVGTICCTSPRQVYYLKVNYSTSPSYRLCMNEGDEKQA
jgi:hypothetical protein